MHYTKTVTVPHGTAFPKGLQPGQWVRLGNAKRSSRFVGYSAVGPLVVRPVGKGRTIRVSESAFRLARDKAKAVVLGVVR